MSWTRKYTADLTLGESFYMEVNQAPLVVVAISIRNVEAMDIETKVRMVLLRSHYVVLKKKPPEDGGKLLTNVN